MIRHRTSYCNKRKKKKCCKVQQQGKRWLTNWELKCDYEITLTHWKYMDCSILHKIITIFIIINCLMIRLIMILFQIFSLICIILLKYNWVLYDSQFNKQQHEMPTKKQRPKKNETIYLLKRFSNDCSP